MYSSRRDTSLVRQSTNFCTRLDRSMEPVSFFLMIQAGLLRVLTGPLVDEHLFGDLLAVLGRVLDEIDLQAAPARKSGHGLLDEA